MYQFERCSYAASQLQCHKKNPKKDLFSIKLCFCTIMIILSRLKLTDFTSLFQFSRHSGEIFYPHFDQTWQARTTAPFNTSWCPRPKVGMSRPSQKQHAYVHTDPDKAPLCSGFRALKTICGFFVLSALRVSMSIDFHVAVYRLLFRHQTLMRTEHFGHSSCAQKRLCVKSHEFTKLSCVKKMMCFFPAFKRWYVQILARSIAVSPAYLHK